MLKFLDSMTIRHLQKQLIFKYSVDTKGWLLDDVSCFMVADAISGPVDKKQLAKAIWMLELECNIWAYGRHPAHELLKGEGPKPAQPALQAGPVLVKKSVANIQARPDFACSVQGQIKVHSSH